MNPYLVFILFIIIFSFLLDAIVNYLNIKHLQTGLPEEFNNWYDAQKYAQSQNYLKENTAFDMISGTVMTVLTLAFILAGGFNFVDTLARGFGFGEIATGLVFAGILLFAMQVIHIPFSAYHTFVIEEKYGFNRTTPKTFLMDILKSWLLSAIIGGLILAVVLWFFEKAGSQAWLYCWAAVTFFQVFLMFIAPVVIMPLFNKFYPIEEGELKNRIEAFARRQGFKLKGVFTMDGSKRSSKANAFFTGFGRFRRVVLFDTLIEKQSIDELVCVLAHEIGHFKKKHIHQRLLISVASTGLMFFILSIFLKNPGLFEAFKMEHLSIYASLVFFGFLYTPIEMILSVFTNILSRKNEFDADAFAVETYGQPEAMITALKKLSVDNLSNLTPHPLMVFLSYSHPPVLQRIERIREKAGGCENRPLPPNCSEVS